jgi:hypothetical protein
LLDAVLADQSPLDGNKARRGGMKLEYSTEVLLGALRHCWAMHIESEHGKIRAENDHGIHCPAMPEKTHGRTAR